MASEYVMVFQSVIAPCRYLVSIDYEAHDGRGHIETTTDVRYAMRFASFVDAFECWRGQSKTVPLRDGGKPNRPLTAYSATFVPVED